MPIIQMTTVVKGTPAPFTLDKAALRDLVPTTSFYHDMANWSKVVLHYLSAEGKQRTFVIFDASGEIPSAPFFISGRARPVFDINAIVIEDFDGGAYLIPKTDLTISEFKVDLTASESGLEPFSSLVSSFDGFSKYRFDLMTVDKFNRIEYGSNVNLSVGGNIGRTIPATIMSKMIDAHTFAFEFNITNPDDVFWIQGGILSVEFFLVPALEVGTPDVSLVSGIEGMSYYIDVSITKTGLDYDYSVTTFEIYRDTMLVANIGPNQQTYRDYSAVQGATHQYQVIARVGSQISMVAGTAEFVPPEPLATPTIFFTDHVSSLGLISVSWASSGADYDYSAMTFDVYRDNFLIATVPNNFTYEDSDVTSGVTYTYKVIGITATQTTLPGEAVFSPDNGGDPSLLAPILGNWYDPNGGGSEIFQVTFNSDNTYSMYQQSAEGSGSEFGTFEWDSVTKAFTVSLDGPFDSDQNAELGFSNLGGDITIDVVQNTLYIYVDGILIRTLFDGDVQPFSSQSTSFDGISGYGFSYMSQIEFDAVNIGINVNLSVGGNIGRTIPATVANKSVVYDGMMNQNVYTFEFNITNPDDVIFVTEGGIVSAEFLLV